MAAASPQIAQPPASPAAGRGHSPSWLLFLCFAGVYVLWGSTYFAIRIGVESIPPFLLAGLRHFITGLVFFPLFRLLTGEKPTAAQWRTTAIVGILLLLAGNGGVSWAETRVPSGIAALIVATVSLWMVLVDWFRPGGQRPANRVLFGSVLGFAGVALLVGPVRFGNSEPVNPVGAAVLFVAALAWAVGSIYSRHNPIPKSPLLGVAMQMLAGGSSLLLISGLSGEWRHFHVSQVTSRSAFALLYLIVFGSALGFSAYVYILKHSTAARVATYAFVNPVVALFLGWSLGGEALSVRTLLASAIVLAAVLIVISARRAPQPARIKSAIPVPAEAGPSLPSKTG